MGSREKNKLLRRLRAETGLGVTQKLAKSQDLLAKLEVTMLNPIYKLADWMAESTAAFITVVAVLSGLLILIAGFVFYTVIKFFDKK